MRFFSLISLGGKYFCCFSHCVFGKHGKKLSISLIFLIILPLIFLLVEISEPKPLNFPTLCALVTVFALMSAISFTSCAFKDPGFLKPAILLENTENFEENARCSACGAPKPSSRTFHCRICGFCVEEMDHHCAWMDNCIGKRNRRVFLVSLAVIATFFALLAVLNAWELQETWRKPPKSLYKPLFFGVFSGTYALAAGFVGFLLVFHCYLVGTQKTTLEFLFKTYKSQGRNPWDAGCRENCARFVCFCRENPKEKDIDAEFLENWRKNAGVC